jgi:hypothetical protein
VVTGRLGGVVHGVVALSPAQTTTTATVLLFDSTNAASNQRFGVVCHGI